MTDEKKDGGKVTDIGKARKKKTEGDHPKAVRKPKREQIQLDLVAAIQRQDWWNKHHPMFEARYEVLEPVPGVRLSLSIEEEWQVATVVAREAVRNDLLVYIKARLDHLDDYLMTFREATETAKLWEAMTLPIPAEDIKMTRWRSEPGLTYRRLPWNRHEGRCPTWDALLLRMTNRQAFQDWVGSLFFDEAHTHNYVWMYGVGNDGKGAISRFLRRVFDKAYAAVGTPTKQGGTPDKFWTYSLLGKRVVIFGDCDDPNFTTSGFFKGLTGGDAVPVERKGGQAFDADLKARYLILANVHPGVSSDVSDMRRIIYCPLEPLESTEDDPGFEARLWDEGGFFLSRCVNGYLKAYPNHTALKPDQTSIRELAEDNEQPIADFFEKFFEVNASGFVSAPELGRALDEARFGRKAKSVFLRWLKREHNIKAMTRNPGKDEKWKAHRSYPGIAMKIVPVKSLYRDQDFPHDLNS